MTPPFFTDIMYQNILSRTLLLATSVQYLLVPILSVLLKSTFKDKLDFIGLKTLLNLSSTLLRL